jgi:hypothetical protein
MEIRFSPRDNGACPVCRRASSCGIRQALAASVKDVRGAREREMELVIYSCPQFVEKPQP